MSPLGTIYLCGNMNEFTRYRVSLGERCVFDDNTEIQIYNASNFDNVVLDELLNTTREIIDVTPNQIIDLYGISLKVPEDAAKMLKWSSSEKDIALVIFLNSNGKVVNNGFAYQIVMENWVELNDLPSDENE